MVLGTRGFTGDEALRATFRVLALLALLRASAAVAQTPREDFLLGMQALRQGEPARAAELFARVHRQTRVPVALYGLGMALRDLGRDQEALNALERYIEQADPQRFRKRVDEAKAAVAELRARRSQMRCALGSACFGPELSVGAPRLFGVGMQLRATPYFGVAAGLRLSPSIDYGPVELRSRTWDAMLRLHPMGNAFFATAGLSFEHLAGEGTHRGVLVEGETDAVALVLGSGLSGRAGLIFGVDANVVIDISRSPIQLRTDQEVPEGTVDVEEVLDQVRAELDDLRGAPPLIFQLNLRAGYLF